MEAQVKLKKAIASYEDFADIYMYENNKKSLANAFGPNCEDVNQYFRVLNRQKCSFITADGVLWEIDPVTGNAAISDSNDQPRYNVLLWTGNGKVNDESNIPSDLKMPSVEPVHCTYYPKTFLRSTSSKLRELCYNRN